MLKEIHTLGESASRALFPFPPYRLGSAAYIDEARDKFAKLERLYQMAQSRAWNGKEVLADLLNRHGGYTQAGVPTRIGDAQGDLVRAGREELVRDIRAYALRVELLPE